MIMQYKITYIREPWYEVVEFWDGSARTVMIVGPDEYQKIELIKEEPNYNAPAEDPTADQALPYLSAEIDPSTGEFLPSRSLPSRAKSGESEWGDR